MTSLRTAWLLCCYTCYTLILYRGVIRTYVTVLENSLNGTQALVCL